MKACSTSTTGVAFGLVRVRGKRRAKSATTPSFSNYWFHAAARP